MSSMFRETRIPRLISIIIAVAVGVWYAISHAYVEFTFFVLMLFLCVGYAIYVESVAQKKDRAITALLNNCKVENFIRLYEGFSKQGGGAGFGPTKMWRLTIELNLATAYLCAGSIDSAGQVLLSIVKFPKSRAGFLSQMVYYSNCVSYYIERGEIAVAEEMLNQFEKVLQSPKLRIRVINMYSGLFERRKRELQIAKENFAGCEQYFEQAFEDAESKLRRVISKYCLAKLYLHQERLDELEEALHYIIENGGDSVYRKRAIAQIRELGVDTHRFTKQETDDIELVEVFTRKESAMLLGTGVALCVIIVIMMLLLTR